MVKGYDLFGDHGRNLPTPHGSGTRPMYADMGKSCRPDPNRKIEYPHVVALFTLDSHNTCLLYTSPSPRDKTVSRMPSSA